MFLWLSKTLPLFIYPVGLTLTLLALALVFHRRARLPRALVFLAMLVLWLGGNRHVAATLVRSLEWRHLPQAEMPEADVIVVLGGGVRGASFPRPLVEVSERGDRLIYAAWLYKQGKAPYVLVSGGSIEWMGPKTIEAENMREFLEMLGVPREAIWLEPNARNTYENALFTRRILEEKGARRVLLVTSAMHMPRSLRLFQNQGVDVTPAPTDFLITQANWEFLRRPDIRAQILHLLPNAQSLDWTSLALKEYIGLFVYALRGWL
ncbi:MAG: YdcF family protein [Chloroflexi bacterium]|nr:YdcF family protein [Chloroflexota bacterium]